ncbi:Nif3-like dinuclear metal center hexameric protein [Flavilitoribacter nigricans]|uniref:GTP cyclohydrolase 1 type 2 homolog n=1 Tax=Flavilitoribacter nigricans (strain ATCC 23147 / DSM 23189 / NBRC 102662 / NCIMB 1420 / SS-2) TaxID=1122177 RepID=A0A2D0N3G3_FLAN2|nr:Nif3-like dinuclear metal center hexameric protein [Flavilitoribacter nigricans]PHN03045.1 Nif3-like dinuclear metal center hexameric protein [Flavilitoribacter nigricans DSM 23189 = NBRC 102662]
MNVKEVITYLDTIAPPVYQESYDNAGLITGSPAMLVSGVVVCLDATEAVLDEAIALGCNLIVAHHPIVFRGLKKITGRNYVERVIIKAIKHDLAIFAAHTNLDNVFRRGVNGRIAERLGLERTQILAPKQVGKKLQIFTPASLAVPLQEALVAVGATRIEGIREAGYLTESGRSQMINGEARVKLEIAFPSAAQSGVLKTVKKYQQEAKVDYDLFSIEVDTPEIGSGVIGFLPEPMAPDQFLKYLKERMQTDCVRHTEILDRQIEKVAVCGGAGGFLLRQAIGQGAQVFVTADYKYHEFFDADGNIIIADIGHYESEQFTIQLLHEIISQKFSNFAVHCTKVRTNPVYYL